jgi:hypothetical protein
MYANVDCVMVVSSILLTVSRSAYFGIDNYLQSTIASRDRETFWRDAEQERG